MLDDRQHVEAVAIMRRLLEGYDPAVLGDREPAIAAEVWLRENHPSTAVYLAALGGGS